MTSWSCQPFPQDHSSGVWIQLDLCLHGLGRHWKWVKISYISKRCKLGLTYSRSIRENPWRCGRFMAGLTSILNRLIKIRSADGVLSLTGSGLIHSEAFFFRYFLVSSIVLSEYFELSEWAERTVKFGLSGFLSLEVYQSMSNYDYPQFERSQDCDHRYDHSS